MILVISSKKVYAAKRLAWEAGIRNQELRIMDMQDLITCNFQIDPNKFDALYIRDPYLKDSPKYTPQIVKLAKKFKAAGKKVVDSAIADGELGQGKWADYQRLQKAGLPIPKTGLLSDYPLPTIHYPLILKWTYGFKAKNVFLIKNQQQLKNILPLHLKKEWLVQEFIKADYEYKVITVGYKALPVVLRFSTRGGSASGGKIKDNGFRTDFKSACSVPIYGRSRQPMNRHATIVKFAERASKILNRELAKVDILEAKGKFYILEVNRFPGLKSFEQLTGYNVFKDFFKYLVLK